MEFHANGSSIFSWITVPEHFCGWENLVHGGVISTMLDEIMARAMIHIIKSLGLTKSMTVDFIKPVYVGKEYLVEGRVMEVKEGREAIIEGIIYDENEMLCSRATGTFMLFSTQAIKRKGISSDEVLEWFEKYIEKKGAPL